MTTLSVHAQRTCALAAVFQASMLVDQVARNGQCSPLRETPLLESIFVFDTTDASRIYPNPADLTPGLRELVEVFGQGGSRDAPVIHYALSLIHLSRVLGKSPDVLNILGNRLREIPESLRQEAQLDPARLYSPLADIYLHTLGTFRFRIQVKGNPTYLQQENHAAHIRALLLAGVRAAMLWYQVGGTRLQLIFNRKRYAAEAQQLLKG